MNDNVLLIGNGINNTTNKQSWENLLQSIITKCKAVDKVNRDDQKPFPLLYEEIYLKSENISETELKEHISQEVQKIQQNDIHSLIQQKKFKNILTTNYEYTLQGTKEDSHPQNEGVIQETKYSVFRHNIVNGTKTWHIHGECNVPNSITLGYEHYGGQLQKIRDYVVSGTHYKKGKRKSQKSLANILKEKKVVTHESWLDLFFTKDIHIIGLSLDFVETDIWWLLTYRARLIKEQKISLSNQIYYYTQEEYSTGNKHKEDLLKSVNIEVIVEPNTGFDFYKKIIEKIN